MPVTFQCDKCGVLSASTGYAKLPRGWVWNPTYDARRRWTGGGEYECGKCRGEAK